MRDDRSNLPLSDAARIEALRDAIVKVHGLRLAIRTLEHARNDGLIDPTVSVADLIVLETELQNAREALQQLVTMISGDGVAA